MKTMYVIKIDDDLYVSSRNIYVNAIIPGIINSPEKSLFISSKRMAKAYIEEFKSSTPEFKDRMTVNEVVFP